MSVCPTNNTAFDGDYNLQPSALPGRSKPFLKPFDIKINFDKTLKNKHPDIYIYKYLSKEVSILKFFYNSTFSSLPPRNSPFDRHYFLYAILFCFFYIMLMYFEFRYILCNQGRRNRGASGVS